MRFFKKATMSIDGFAGKLAVRCVLGLIIAFSFSTLSFAQKAGDTKTLGGIELVYCPAGSFMMGAVPDDVYASDIEKPRHKVTLDGFWIGKYDVTQEQYEIVMGTNPSNFKGKPKNPVENVSWYDAVEFCNALSKAKGLTPYYTIDKAKEDPNNLNSDDDKIWLVTVKPNANGFRLPTEAEWEYANRAGSETIYYWGNIFNEGYGWYNGNSNLMTQPVGKKKPNRWGLYDMSGNVMQWCWDWCDDIEYYMVSEAVNPKGAEKGELRALRGGSWYNDETFIRSSCRNGSNADNRACKNCGFRVVAPAQK